MNGVSGDCCGLCLRLLDDERGLAVVKDTWDDEQDVKDSWDVDEEEAKPAAKPKAAKQAVRPAAAAAKASPAAAAAVVNETEGERKARLERLVQERDLDNAYSLFGIEGGVRESAAKTLPGAATIAASSPFDTLHPQTAPEFDQFARLITKRLEAFEVDTSLACDHLVFG